MSDNVRRSPDECSIWDFVSTLPGGLDTAVGSRGAQMSGGQRQRLAIARALVRDPKVLLLDEATSALDSESEQIVQAAIRRASNGRTTIAIAHRLSTIRQADRIYVLDSGRIVEEGTYASLIRRDGLFAQLARAQTLD